MKGKSAARSTADIETSYATEEVEGIRRLAGTRGVRCLFGGNFADIAAGRTFFFRVFNFESAGQFSQTYRAFVVACLLAQARCHVLLRVAGTAAQDSVVGTRIIEIVGHGTFLSSVSNVPIA